MIVVKLNAGLGNQMFQYAFARYLQTIYNEPIVLETVTFSKSSRKFGLHKLSVPLCNSTERSSCRIAGKIENYIYFFISKAIREFYEKIVGIPLKGQDAYWKMIEHGFYTTKDAFMYYEFKRTKVKVKFVRGYFQSELYFREIKNIIKKELLVKETAQYENLARQLRNQDSISIHIRRGDYIGSKLFEVCTEEYFEKAVNYMVDKFKNPKFYVFSNSIQDLQWIKENYHFLNNAHYVIEGNDEYGDLYLMYNCRHHIISNSTFSWWGSYLSEYEGITIAPKKWVNLDEKQYADVVVEGWITL